MLGLSCEKSRGYVYYAGKRCRERIQLEPTPANLKRVAQHRAAVLDAIARGAFDYAVTFPGSKRAEQFEHAPHRGLLTEAYLEDWLTRKKPLLKASTWRDYEKTIYGQLIPQFGTVPLSDLKRPDVKAWVTTLTAGNKRIANVLSVLRAALQEACDDDLIEANPLRDWTYRKVEATKDIDDVDPFTAEEQTAILGQLEGQSRNLIQFAFWTGMRTSELVALNWTDIDWKREVVKVRRARTQAASVDEVTKTRAGNREIKILPPAQAALAAQTRLTADKAEEVFQNPNTTERWSGDQPIRKTLWVPALQRATVRYRRLWVANSYCDAIRRRATVLRALTNMVRFAACANSSSSPST